MNADIITIGDEILIGQVVDTNSAWLAKQLHNLGILVNEIKSISDTPDAICEAIQMSKASIVFLTGGLGPTNDDLTKKTLASYFKSELVFNSLVFNHIEKLFGTFNETVNILNRQQAMLPDKAKILPNKNGTAAGMWFTEDNQHIISLPGVPYEMKSIVLEHLLPQLSKIYNLKPIFFKTIMVVGIPESILADRIVDWESTLPKYIKLAYLPRPGVVRLRLSISGEDYEKNLEEIDRVVADLATILPQEIFSFEDCQIEDVISKLLIDKGKTVATAESCTGGSIASHLTSIPGSSVFYKGSVVAYSNEVKQNILNVDKEAILEYGAVSKEVVKQMAGNLRQLMKVDYAIATSGIAGPGGGSKIKPVGTTWIALASEDFIITQCFSLGNDRERNIEKASIFALNMLRLMIVS